MSLCTQIEFIVRPFALSSFVSCPLCSSPVTSASCQSPHHPNWSLLSYCLVCLIPFDSAAVFFSPERWADRFLRPPSSTVQSLIAICWPGITRTSIFAPPIICRGGRTAQCRPNSLPYACFSVFHHRMSPNSCLCAVGSAMFIKFERTH